MYVHIWATQILFNNSILLEQNFIVPLLRGSDDTKEADGKADTMLKTSSSESGIHRNYICDKLATSLDKCRFLTSCIHDAPSSEITSHSICSQTALLETSCMSLSITDEQFVTTDEASCSHTTERLYVTQKRRYTYSIY